MAAEAQSWVDFFIYLTVHTPVFAAILQTYPVGCALGIYWTQGIKRSQRRKKWRGRENLTAGELRALSGCLSAGVITLLLIAFHVDIPKRQVLVHSVIGGAACPLIMWAVITLLELLGTRFEWARLYVDRLKRGDRRKRPTTCPPVETGERRNYDETGEFWSNR